MEILLSAVLGELTARSINFIINKCSKPPVLGMEESLQRVLLRAQIIIDEAMGRLITNQAMIQQLDMLRDAMHRGYYTLDTFRYQPHKENAKNQIVSRSWSLSKVSSLNGPCFSGRSEHILKQLREALDRLSSMIVDVDELIRFLTSYPRLYRQPYSMHILLGNCMFGRQTEAEHVIRFLLHAQPDGSEELEVLPIVGPNKVGKSTLVAHVCKDERVRDHFSEILFLCDPGFTDDELTSLRDGCAMKHQNCMSNSDKDRRLLVVELDADLNEDAWNRLYSASKWSMQSGSKIIVTSRSDKIVKLGTTGALTLKYLSHEAYWYFFKTILFGSMDPEMHPRLTLLAMEVARTLNGSLTTASYMACFLRENFDIHFWYKILAFFGVSFKKHISKFGVHPMDRLWQNRTVHVGRMASACEELVLCHEYERSSQEEAPKITFQDVLFGSVKPHGKFEVLLWRARIPPCYSYLKESGHTFAQISLLGGLEGIQSFVTREKGNYLSLSVKYSLV